MSDKSINPKGTKDYGPIELLSRRFIINTIRKVFISFGYSEIETPSMEKDLHFMKNMVTKVTSSYLILLIVGIKLKRPILRHCPQEN